MATALPDGGITVDAEATGETSNGDTSNGEAMTDGTATDENTVIGDDTDDATGTEDGVNTGDSDLDASPSDGTANTTFTFGDVDASDASSDAGDDAGSDAGHDAGDDAGFNIQPVNLGQAGNYVILAKTGISATGTTAIVGDIAISPADATYITGFDLKGPPTMYSTSDLVTGLVWAADYDVPTPANLTTAVLDMETAYTDAAGRTLPDYIELGAGNIDGMTLSPGLYKWGTGVTVPNNVTLDGDSTGVWIFQIAQDLLLGNGAGVNLGGQAQPENVFWQVAGQATLGTTSSFQGVLLSQTLIEFNTGAKMTGRALAQTAVTLDATFITGP